VICPTALFNFADLLLAAALGAAFLPGVRVTGWAVETVVHLWSRR
jgi:hypothetical protein